MKRDIELDDDYYGQSRWIAPEGKTYNYYLNQNSLEIFEDFKMQTKRYYFSIDKWKFYYHKTHDNIGEKKGNLRCQYHKSGCPSRALITKRGILNWFSGTDYEYGDLEVTKHIFSLHIKKGTEGSNETGEDDKSLFDIQEVEQYVDDNEDKTAKEILSVFSDAIRKGNVEKENVLNTIKSRQRRNQPIDNRIDLVETCPIIKIYDQPERFCRVSCTFVDKNQNIQKFAIFSCLSQTALLLQSPVLVIDGWFKLAIKKYKQMVTICAYMETKKMYLPIGHLLLSNAKQETYEKAFKAFKELADKDNNHCVRWKNLSILSDHEPALRNAIRDSFNPKFLNGCFFHYFRAIKMKLREFSGKAGLEAHATLLSTLYHKPFLWKITENLKSTENSLLNAAFYLSTKNGRIDRFRTYYMRKWELYKHSFDSDLSHPIQRTTNGVECFHMVLKSRRLHHVKDFKMFMRKLICVNFDIFIEYKRTRINENVFKWEKVLPNKLIKSALIEFSRIKDNFIAETGVTPDEFFKEEPNIEILDINDYENNSDADIDRSFSYLSVEDSLLLQELKEN